MKVDIRNGLIATELTPSQFVQERRALVIPDSVQGYARDQALEWARTLSVSVAPAERSDGNADLPVRIDSPKDRAKVKGIELISGKADSPDFVAYRVEIGLGDPPLSWSLLNRSTNKQPNGGLALWNTAGLPDGLYTLRLVVEDAQRGELSTFITVQLGGEHPADTTVHGDARSVETHACGHGRALGERAPADCRRHSPGAARGSSDTGEVP